MDAKYKYGHTFNEWNKAKTEIRNILIEKAKNRAMITYSDLVSKVRTINLEPESYALAIMLGEISSEELLPDEGCLPLW